MLDINPSARMQVLSLGALMHPGTCMVCGNGTCEEGYLDLGVFFDYEGHMYLCVTCAKEVGSSVGMLLPDEVAITSSLLDTLDQENTRLKAELNDALEYVSASNSLLRSVHSPAHHSSESSDPSDQGDSEPPSDNADSVSVGETDEPESAKPVKKSRRKHVSVTESDNSAAFGA